MQIDIKNQKIGPEIKRGCYLLLVSSKNKQKSRKMHTYNLEQDFNNCPKFPATVKTSLSLSLELQPILPPETQSFVHLKSDKDAAGQIKTW